MGIFKVSYNRAFSVKYSKTMRNSASQDIHIFYGEFVAFWGNFMYFWGILGDF
jgi:hypothetical protein